MKRSTLSDANKSRDYHIYEQLFYKILYRCKDITPKNKFRFKNPLYLIDATVIALCLSTFDWAKFRTTKGAIRIHCLFEHSGQIPTFMVITDAKQHEITVARCSFVPVADSIYCFDRGYIDYRWFSSIDHNKAYFITRAKDNIKYTVTGQHSEPKKNSVISDETIVLTGYYQQQYYPKELRLIHYYDKDLSLRAVKNNFVNYVLNIPFEHQCAATRSGIKEENEIRAAAQKQFVSIWREYLPVNVSSWRERLTHLFQTGN